MLPDVVEVRTGAAASRETWLLADLADLVGTERCATTNADSAHRGTTMLVVQFVIAVPIAEYFRKLAGAAGEAHYAKLAAWWKRLRKHAEDSNRQVSVSFLDNNSTEALLDAAVPTESLLLLANIADVGVLFVFDEQIGDWVASD